MAMVTGSCGLLQAQRRGGFCVQWGLWVSPGAQAVTTGGGEGGVRQSSEGRAGSKVILGLVSGPPFPFEQPLQTTGYRGRRVPPRSGQPGAAVRARLGTQGWCSRHCDSTLPARSALAWPEP